MEWYEVKTFKDCQVEYIYDDTVRQLMNKLSEMESFALESKDYNLLGLIRKYQMNTMAMAVPRVVIRNN